MRPGPGSAPSVWARVLALVMLALLAGLTVYQRVERTRLGYRVRRLLDENSELRNEVLWLEAEVEKLGSPVALLSRAEAMGLGLAAFEGETRRAASARPSYPRE